MKYPIELEDDDRITNVGPSFDITDEARRLADRPYRIAIWRDEDGYWCGEIPELLGHGAAGETFEEMVALAEDAKVSWIAVALDEGEAIPDPVPATTAQASNDDKLIVDLRTLVQTALGREAAQRGVSPLSLAAVIREHPAHLTHEDTPSRVAS